MAELQVTQLDVPIAYAPGSTADVSGTMIEHHVGRAEQFKKLTFVLFLRCPVLLLQSDGYLSYAQEWVCLQEEPSSEPHKTQVRIGT